MFRSFSNRSCSWELSCKSVVKLKINCYHRILFFWKVHCIYNITPELCLISLWNKPFFISEFINDTFLYLVRFKINGLCLFAVLTSVPHGLIHGLEECVSIAKERIDLSLFQSKVLWFFILFFSFIYLILYFFNLYGIS